MKKLSLIALTVAILSTSASAQTLVSISGSTLTGYSALNQESGNSFRGQFESAANLGVNLQQGEELFVDFELALAGLGSESGFGLGLLYFTLTYKPELYKNVEVAIGSMTQPFGQFGESQTDNSSIFSPFIYNDLAYTLLKKNDPVYQFASNGIKVTTELSHGTLAGSLFNGTDGFDNNPDKGYGVAVRYLNKTFKDSIIGLSYFNSNDFGNTNGAGYDSNTTGYMIDFKTNIQTVEVGLYVARLTFDDYDPATEDNVSSFMGYLSKNYGSHTLALRYSVVNPEDYDGSGSGMSNAIEAPLGLSNITITDIDLARLQWACVFHLSDTFNLHNEVVYDSYGDNQTDFNNIGFLSYASLKF